MTDLADLQSRIVDLQAFKSLEDYRILALAFIEWLEEAQLTPIVSPSSPNYIFYQYSEVYRKRITRPLNTNLFLHASDLLQAAFERFAVFLNDLRVYQDRAVGRAGVNNYIQTGEINRVVYTAQQSIGCIADSFDEPNQARKRNAA